MEFFLFQSRMRLSFESLVAKAQAAGFAGMAGMAGMDHLSPPGADRNAIAETAMRRFGHSSPVVGTGSAFKDYFGHFARHGIERAYTWFCDFASPDTLEGFGSEFVAKLRAK